MKRIIYGSLSVLTAVGTVFVAAKAEVFNAENKSSQLSEEIADANVSSDLSADTLSDELANELAIGSGLGSGPNSGLKSGLSGRTNNPLQSSALLGGMTGQAGVNPALKSSGQNLNALKSAGGGNDVLGSQAFSLVPSSSAAPGTPRPAQAVNPTPTIVNTAPAPVASAPAIAAPTTSSQAASSPTSAVSVTGTPLDVQAVAPSAPTLSGVSTLQAQAAPVDAAPPLPTAPTAAPLPVEPAATGPATKPMLEESALEDAGVEAGAVDDEAMSAEAAETESTGTEFTEAESTGLIEADAITNTPAPGAASTLTPSGTSLPAPGTVVPGTVVPNAPGLGAPALDAPTLGSPIPETGLDASPGVETDIEAEGLKPEAAAPIDPALAAPEGAAELGETEADMAEDPEALGEKPAAESSLDEMPEAEVPEAEMPEVGMPEAEGFPEGATEGDVFEEEPFEGDASADEPLEESTFEESGEALEETEDDSAEMDEIPGDEVDTLEGEGLEGEADIESDAIPAVPEAIPGATPMPPADGTLMPDGSEEMMPPLPEQGGAPTQVVPAQPPSPDTGLEAPGLPAEPEMPAAPIEPLPPVDSEVVPGDEAPVDNGLDNGSGSEFESDAAPEEFPVSESSSDRLIGEGFTPFQLSYLAISGGLKDEGIPGGGLLLNAYDAGDISAEDIVAAGASSKRLGSAADDEVDFTKGVDRFLEIFKRDARSSN